jgi:hypothetical protein
VFRAIRLLSIMGALFGAAVPGREERNRNRGNLAMGTIFLIAGAVAGGGGSGLFGALEIKSPLEFARGNVGAAVTFFHSRPGLRRRSSEGCASSW